MNHSLDKKPNAYEIQEESDISQISKLNITQTVAGDAKFVNISDDPAGRENHY